MSYSLRILFPTSYTRRAVIHLFKGSFVFIFFLVIGFFSKIFTIATFLRLFRISLPIYFLNFILKFIFLKSLSSDNHLRIITCLCALLFIVNHDSLLFIFIIIPFALAVFVDLGFF